MKTIKNDVTREFIDESGDRLITLIGPRKRDYDQREQVILDMAKIDFTTNQTPTLEGMKIDQAKINEVMFKAVAKKMIIAGEEFEGDALMEIYNSLDKESGDWVASCIKNVWGEDEESKKK